MNTSITSKYEHLNLNLTDQAMYMPDNVIKCIFTTLIIKYTLSYLKLHHACKTCIHTT